MERHLDLDFRVYPLGDGTVDGRAVRHIAGELGVQFPDDYVAHLCGRFPGLLVLAKEEIWPAPKALDVGPFWTFLNGVQSFTPLGISDDWMRLDIAGQQFQSSTGLAAAPILKRRGDPNVFCVDPAGDIVAFDHETNSLEAVELDFWALFEGEIAALAERKQRLVRERTESASASDQ